MNTQDPKLVALARRVFWEALEFHSAEQRRDYLKTACQGRPDLQQLVEELLAGASDNGFLESSPVARRRDPGLLHPGKPPETDLKVGRYRLLERIGEGGCGTVYAAEQLEGVRRRLALKLIKPGMDSRAVIDRFEAERQALALMDHPHIAKIFDAGTTESGRPFFAMELVDGLRITDYSVERQLVLPERLELFLQVCDAVQHAHQKGVIHRDLKPSNILVTHSNGGPSVKVIDFGIAKAIAGKLTDVTLHTGLHQLIGTPAYMSPEQADLSPDIDTRTDIYSLGVLLYELLTGQPPFEHRQLVDAGFDEMRRIIREVEPPRPSERLRIGSVGSVSQDPDLDWIALKCLEKDRTRRYTSASGLSADIRRYLNSEPVTAHPPTQTYRLQKYVRRHRLQVASAVIVVAALAFAAVVGTWQAWKARRAERAAREQAGHAEATRDFLIDALFGGDPVDPRRDADALTFEATQALARKVAARLEGKFVNQPLTEAEFHYALCRVFLASRDFPAVAAHAERARQIWDREFGPTHERTIDAMREVVYADLQLGRRHEAFRLASNTLALVRASPAANPLTVGKVLGAMGALLRLDGRPREAVAPAEEAHSLIQGALGRDNHTTLMYKSELAGTLEQADDRKAEPLFRELVADSLRIHGPEEFVTLWMQMNLASHLVLAGNTNEAIPMLERLTDAFPRRLPATHAFVIQCKWVLANAYDLAQQTEKASRLHTEVHPFWANLYPLARALRCNVTTAEFFVKSGEIEKARTVFEGLRQALDKNPPHDPHEFETLLRATAATRGWPAAAEACRQRIGFAPDSGLAWLLKAWIFCYVQDERSYREVAHRALELAPRLSADQQHLPIEIAALGDAGLSDADGELLEKVIASLEGSLPSREGGAQVVGYRAIGHYRLRQQRFKESLVAIEKAERVQSRPDPYTLFLKAACHFHLGNSDTAADVFRHAVKISDRQLPATNSRSDEYLSPGQLYQHLVMRREVGARLASGHPRVP